MRILFLDARVQQPDAAAATSSSTDAGHEVSVEFDINDRVTEEAVALFRPELDRRAVPEARAFPNRSGASIAAS